MARGKISKRAVDAISPGGGDQFLWDEALKGFGLKVTSTGSKTYLIQYRMGGREAATRRYTIGKHGSPWTAEQAREEAGRLLSLVSQGVDPQAQQVSRREAAVNLAFDAYVDRYLRDYGSRRWRRTTYPTVESNLRRFAVPILRKKSLPEIRRVDLMQIFDALPGGKPALPRNVYAHLSKVFSWALERGDIDRSPFDGFRAPPAVASRDRVLNDEELALVWRASEQLNYPFGPIIRLLMMTGQRREEVASLNWSEVNQKGAEWVLPPERAKNGRRHVVPLCGLAAREIAALSRGATWPTNGLVFTTTSRSAVSGHSRAKARLDKIIRACAGGRDIPPWRVHDLRRTLATGFQKLGIRFEVTEAVLNHVSGSRSGVAGVYQRHSWSEEKRNALEAWSSHVSQLLQRTVTG